MVADGGVAIQAHAWMPHGRGGALMTDDAEAEDAGDVDAEGDK